MIKTDSDSGKYNEKKKKQQNDVTEQQGKGWSEKIVWGDDMQQRPK